MNVDPQLLAQVLAGLGDGITVQDREFRILYQNRVLVAALGRFAEGSLGRKCYEVYERRDNVCDGCGVALAFATGETNVALREVDGPDGRRITWEITCFPLRDERGEIVAGVEVCRDLTARRVAEEALRVQQCHAESLLRLARRLESAGSYHEAVGVARDEVRRTVGYASLWAYLFSDDHRYADIIAADGSMADSIRGQSDIARLTIAGDMMLEEIARTRDIVVVEDAATDPRTDKDIVARLGNRTLVNVPILLFDRHVGSIGTGTFGDEGIRPPTPAERDYLMALASHLATALDRIRLVDEQRQAAESLRRVNRKLRAVSTCNQILIRVTDEQTLLDEVCRVICDEAGYRIACVGFVEHDEARTIRLAAWAGADSAEFAAARFSWSETDERGRGPAGDAVRSGRTTVVQDIETDSRLVAWRERSRRWGLRSGLALPLKDNLGAVIGVLFVCSGEPDVLTADETALMEELAGDLAFGLTTLRDRAAREQARRQIQLLSAALDSVHEAAYLIDENGRFLYVNDGACRALEYTREELLGLSVSDIDPGFPAAAAATAAAELRRRGAMTFEARHRTKSGREFPVEINSSCLVFEGVVFDLALARDISERRRLEEELRQAHKLESIGLLAGGVAHDFNNMLAIILGSAEMAQGVVEAGHPAQPWLESIVKAANSSAELTRQLLTFARRQMILPKVFALDPAIVKLLRTLERLVGEDVRLDWRPGGPDLAVNLDPVQLDQMLVNLCANARDAVVPGGRVTLATRREQVAADTPGRRPECAPGPYAVLEVADDGHGMDPETRARIFEPFFTTKESGRGTGLGLATVYGIATQNRGFVQVDSEPGRGTTFRVYLPLVPQAAPAPAATAGPATRPRGHETILVVEDDRAILELTGRLLADCGYRVLTAATAVEAFRQAEAHRESIDLLVTDVVMPGLNGCELAAALSARLPGLRCLYVSGYPAEVIERQGLTVNGLRLLCKPFPLEALAVAVRDALDGQGAAARTVEP